MAANYKNFEKTWLPGTSRVNQTFNAPGNITVPYGRFQAQVTGKGGPGNSPQATAWATNYNVAYPIANRPLANQPATGWTTNYNVAYPVTYPYAASHPAYAPPNAWATGHHSIQTFWSRPSYGQSESYTTGPNPYGGSHCGLGPSYYSGPSYLSSHTVHYSMWNLEQCQISPGYTYTVTNYNVAYNVAYPIANQPATAWTSNYNTNYNTIYPIANQPVTAYVLGNIGAASSALGVTAPGGPVSQAASPISPTAVSYYSYPDNATYPVTVPSGGQINITLT